MYRLISLCAVIALLCGTFSIPAQAVTNAGSISGTVTIKGLGTPARGLTVTLRQFYSGIHTTVIATDNDGRYSFPSPQPYSFDVLFGQPGCFYLQQSTATVCYAHSKIYEVTDASLSFTVDATLDQAVEISGKVIAADSRQPLPFANVLAHLSTDFDFVHTAVVANGNGEFSFTAIRPGAYDIHAKSTTDSLGKAYSGVYFDGKLNAGTADLVTVMAGVKNITLALRPTAQVSGRVRSAVDGSPIANIRVTTQPQVVDEFTSLATTTGANGEFAFAVPTGTYVLNADVSGTNYALTPSLTVQNVVTAGVSNADLFLNAGGRIVGRILGGTGQANVFAIDFLSGAQVEKCTAEHYTYRYDCANLQEGTYILWITSSCTALRSCKDRTVPPPQYYRLPGTTEPYTPITVTALFTTSIDVILTADGRAPALPLTNRAYLPLSSR